MQSKHIPCNEPHGNCKNFMICCIYQKACRFLVAHKIGMWVPVNTIALIPKEHKKTFQFHGFCIHKATMSFNKACIKSNAEQSLGEDNCDDLTVILIQISGTPFY